MQIEQKCRLSFWARLPQETFGLVYLEANQVRCSVITIKEMLVKKILHDKNNFLNWKRITKFKILADWLTDIEQKQGQLI